MYDGLDVTFGLGGGFEAPKPILHVRRLHANNAIGSPFRTDSLDDAQVGTGGRIA